MLSALLYKHYGKKTVILIDEYDVPLDKAFQHGYYKEMVFLIRAMFGKALKQIFVLPRNGVENPPSMWYDFLSNGRLKTL